MVIRSNGLGSSLTKSINVQITIAAQMTTIPKMVNTGGMSVRVQASVVLARRLQAIEPRFCVSMGR
jgi:hypothetical protein